MRTSLIEGFIRHLDPDDAWRIGDYTPEVEAAFEKLPLPMDLKRLLQWSWPQEYAHIGGIELYDAESILAEDWQPKLLERKMIMIGKAGNGDALVIRFEEEAHCPVGFIRLEEFASKSPRVETMYFEIESSLERFFFRAAEKLYLPRDSYDGAEWDAFKRSLEPRRP